MFAVYYLDNDEWIMADTGLSTQAALGLLITLEQAGLLTGVRLV